jgi:uroporphyrinogen decarboxylase
MNSRERVRAVLAHKIPDRVPNGLGGCETAGMHIVAYDRLQKVLGCESAPPRLDTFMVNAVFEEPVIKAMDGDIILLDSPRMCKSQLRGDVDDQWKEQALWGKQFRVPTSAMFEEREDGATIWKGKRDKICPKGGYYFDSPAPTDMTADLIVPDPDAYNPSPELPEERLRALEEQAKRLYNETDLSICLGETVHDLQVKPGGMVNAMMLMLEEPDVMHALLKKSVEVALKHLKQVEQAVGKYVDILAIAHDFGDNRGVTIGDGLWREIYKPHYQKLFGEWKKITDMKINLHSCGSISSIMDDLIECGVDVINPVQTAAANMEAASLKQRFGDRVIFYGGAYDAQLLPQSMTYEEVYNAVCNNIKVLGKGGNFIFAGVHNLPGDMPEHHIKAMMDAYFDTRAYEKA